MNRARQLAAGLLSLLLGACALTPDYTPPELGVPETFVQPADGGASMANVDWFDLFDDPVLVEHIRTALAQNQDRAVALARIAEARQFVTVTRADQYPFLDITAAASRNQTSQELVPGASASDSYSVAAGFSLELDIWRRFARATEASIADLMATEAAYRSITIRLVADVAATYLQLRDLDARLAIARHTVESRTDSLAIIQARFDKGVVAEIDTSQAEIQLAIAEAAVASFERAIAQTANALRVLRGGFPGPVERGDPLTAWNYGSAVPAGLPVELLQRRPDLVAAERTLAAETARIGVTEALRWPSLSLTAALGRASDELSGLNNGTARAWDVGTGLFAPIFNSGQLKAQAQAQRERTTQALLTYEGAVRQTLREVEDALVEVRTRRDELTARSRQVTAARNALRLSRARYDGGLVNYLEVLEADRSLFNAEIEQSAARAAALVAMVRLYQALGGGWTPPA